MENQYGQYVPNFLQMYPPAPAPTITPSERATSCIAICVVAAEVSIERTYQDGGKTIGVIRVEVEETLGHYAEWAGVQTWQIRRLNDLAYGRTLHLHQKLKVPLNKTASHLFEQSRYEHHKRIQEDFFSAYRIGELAPYRIQRGDNYWTLCREKFDIPMWLLTHFNPEVDLADLRVHQKLMIPAIEKRLKDANELQSPPDAQDFQWFSKESNQKSTILLRDS